MEDGKESEYCWKESKSWSSYLYRFIVSSKDRNEAKGKWVWVERLRRLWLRQFNGKGISQFHGREEPEIRSWNGWGSPVKASLSFHPISSIVYCKFHLSEVPMSLELKKAERGHHSFIREKRIFLCHIPKMRMRVPSYYWSLRQVRVSSGAWPRRSSAKPIDKRERSGQAKLLPFALDFFIYYRVEQRLLYLS